MALGLCKRGGGDKFVLNSTRSSFQMLNATPYELILASLKTF